MSTKSTEQEIMMRDIANVHTPDMEPAPGDDTPMVIRKRITQWLMLDQIADQRLNLLARNEDYRCAVIAERNNIQAELARALSVRCERRHAATGWTPQNLMNLHDLLSDWVAINPPPNSSGHRLQVWIVDLTGMVGGIIRRTHGLEQ